MCIYADILLSVHPCSDYIPGPAERAMARHRADVREVLIDLLERPIPESDLVGREIMTRVMGRPVDFRQPIIDISSNADLKALARNGVPPIVWETSGRMRATHERTVLDPIATAGQEVLLEFLGMYIQ